MKDLFYFENRFDEATFFFNSRPYNIPLGGFKITKLLTYFFSSKASCFFNISDIRPEDDLLLNHLQRPSFCKTFNGQYCASHSHC